MLNDMRNYKEMTDNMDASIIDEVAVAVAACGCDVADCACLWLCLWLWRLRKNVVACCGSGEPTQDPCINTLRPRKVHKWPG